MQTMFKGAVSFGLVNIPVKMFTATEDRDIRFRSLHKKCHTPIKYKKTCPLCNEEVGPDDIVKGFEYEPGKFVIVSDEDMESARAEVQARTIEIVDFVSLPEIDPIYFDKTYYLAPQPEITASAKAYTLLREAMNQSQKIAVARVTIRNKQTLCVLRGYGDVLALETIFYPDEIRPVDEIPALPQGMKTDEKEMGIAKQLIDNLTARFEPEKYTDEYRVALRAVIDAKIAGKEVVIQPEMPETNVIDLMEALKASIEKTEKKTKKAPPKRRAN
ncbi:MAG: Ku protein [Eubacteriales bacterium]|nr:Ku protein [Eubacteriales bacterium]